VKHSHTLSHTLTLTHSSTRTRSHSRRRCAAGEGEMRREGSVDDERGEGRRWCGRRRVRGARRQESPQTVVGDGVAVEGGNDRW